MNKEDYVSLQVAKLLKEKGYNEYCRVTYFYDANNLTMSSVFNRKNTELNDNCYSCPTLYEAQKWIRERKNINIMIDFDESQLWGYSIHECNDKDSFIANDSLFNSYEEALNSGILEALKMI